MSNDEHQDWRHREVCSNRTVLSASATRAGVVDLDVSWLVPADLAALEALARLSCRVPVRTPARASPRHRGPGRAARVRRTRRRAAPVLVLPALRAVLGHGFGRKAEHFEQRRVEEGVQDADAPGNDVEHVDKRTRSGGPPSLPAGTRQRPVTRSALTGVTSSSRTPSTASRKRRMASVLAARVRTAASRGSRRRATRQRARRCRRGRTRRCTTARSSDSSAAGWLGAESRSTPVARRGLDESVLLTASELVSRTAATSAARHRSTSRRMSTGALAGSEVLQCGDEREPHRLP